MTPSELLYIIKIIAIPMWVLMVILPEWKMTRYLIDRKIAPNAMFLVYLGYLILSLQHDGVFSFGSIGSAIELVTFQNGILALIVLFHSWNLLIGMWILDKGLESDLPYIFIIPCVIAAYYISPIGFLLFVIIRRINKVKKITSLSV